MTDILIRNGDVWQPYKKDDIIIQFTTSREAALPDEIIYFYDATWPQPKSVDWFFGDGSETNGCSCTHSYSNEGTYSIGMIINYDVGSVSKIFKDAINIDHNNIDPIGPTNSII
jgi:PKD repeat protein